MEQRPAIPRAMRRAILVEAGHRCAIPTCRSESSIEIAHIVPWAQVQKHEEDNLIALCPNCHTRADRGEIDRTSLRNYKKICQGLVRPQLTILQHLGRYLVPEVDPTTSRHTYIRFNPNTGEILNSRNIISMTDGGEALGYAIVFSTDFPDTNYVFQVGANGSVTVEKSELAVGSISLVFGSPCPDIVDINFY